MGKVTSNLFFDFSPHSYFLLLAMDRADGLQTLLTCCDRKSGSVSSESFMFPTAAPISAGEGRERYKVPQLPPLLFSTYRSFQGVPK